MKRTQLFITLFSAATFAVAVGCKQESDVPPPPVATSQDPSAQMDKPKPKAEGNPDVPKEYTYAQRAEYMASIRADLAELNKELDQLAVKVEGSSAEAKADAKAKLQEVRDKIARLSEKLDGVQNSTESTWEDVKSQVKKGYDEVKDSFKQARQWLSEKIKP